MPRREALRRLGLLAGGALSASTVVGLLAGCRAERSVEGGYVFRALDADQQELTGALVDILLPATDTPGAREAGVPAFIDKLLADWMTGDESARFLAGLEDVDARAQGAHGARFVDIGAARQTTLVAALDREAFPPYEEPPGEAEAAEASAGNAQSGTTAMADAGEQQAGQVAAPPEEASPPFFSTLKELTVAGYYTSEVGASQELRWSAAPGEYRPDVPLAEVGRAWA